MIRSLLITAVVLGASTLAGTPDHSTAAATPEGDVPFDTLGIVTGVEAINLWQPALLRVRDNDDVGWARDVLANGVDNPFADRVVESIGEIPDGQVVLIGVIDVSCTPATTAGLVRDNGGHLTMSAPGHVPEPIQCFVPVVTVAVLSVDAGDAPPGSTDFAEFVAFESVYEPLLGRNAVELTTDGAALASVLPNDATAPKLPPLADGNRRFAFTRPGCRHTTAELIVTRLTVDARPVYDEPGARAVCEIAEWYVAVFDIPNEHVLDSAVLVGSLDR